MQTIVFQGDGRLETGVQTNVFQEDGSTDNCSARRNEAEVYNSTGAFAHSGNTRKKWDGLDLKT